MPEIGGRGIRGFYGQTDRQTKYPSAFYGTSFRWSAASLGFDTNTLMFCSVFVTSPLNSLVLLVLMGVLDGTSADVPGVGLKMASVLFCNEKFWCKWGNKGKNGEEN